MSLRNDDRDSDDGMSNEFAITMTTMISIK